MTIVQEQTKAIGPVLSLGPQMLTPEVVLVDSRSGALVNTLVVFVGLLVIDCCEIYLRWSIGYRPQTKASFLGLFVLLNLGAIVWAFVYWRRRLIRIRRERNELAEWRRGDRELTLAEVCQRFVVEQRSSRWQQTGFDRLAMEELEQKLKVRLPRVWIIGSSVLTRLKAQVEADLTTQIVRPSSWRDNFRETSDFRFESTDQAGAEINTELTVSAREINLDQCMLCIMEGAVGGLQWTFLEVESNNYATYSNLDPRVRPWWKEVESWIAGRDKSGSAERAMEK